MYNNSQVLRIIFFCLENTFFMNIWLIFIIIFLSLFLILLAPMPIAYKIYANILANKAFALVKCGVFRLLAIQMEVMGGDLILTNPNGKMRKVKIKKPTTFQNEFVVSLFKELDITKLVAYFGCGIKSDAFLTSMSCGAVGAIFSVVGKVIKDKNNAFIFYQIEPNYNKDDLWIAVDGTFRICFLAIIFALLKSVFKNKGVNNERRKFAK